MEGSDSHNYHAKDTRKTLCFKGCVIWEKYNLIIGYTWLHKHNPEINWETGKVDDDEMSTKNVTYQKKKAEKEIKKRKKRSRGREKYKDMKSYDQGGD